MYYNKMTSEDSSAFKYNPDENYDEATMMQQREIETKIAESQPLIGNIEDLSNLISEFADDEVYVAKVKQLQKKYTHFRHTRGDGNCFYRAFGFAYMEKLLTDKEELTRFRDLIEKSKDDLISLGFPQFTIEDFHDVFLEVLDKVKSGCGLNGLLETFNDQGYSDYLVVYLRLLVSGHLQKEAEFYASFVEGGRTVKEFCQQEVEPMGRESDHIHISTLTKSTGVPIRIEYMDRSSGTKVDNQVTVNHHDFPDDTSPQICLIYRPGHYDILYV
jgi:ubiquitin thioesterase protein OTUB1